jgi:integrase
MLAPTVISGSREPWNKGKLVGQKAPLKLRDIWAIRVRLEMTDRKRELALFNLAIDSKLRGCDLVQLRVRDVAHGDRIAARAIVMQQKTQRPVQFEITEPTRKAVFAWIRHAALKTEDYLFPSRLRAAALPASVDTAIRPNRRSLGHRNRLGCRRIRNPHHAPYEGIADLPADEEPARSAAAAWSFKIGKHSEVPRDRGR